jgi:DNA invertase Pin-like site-specific DNA recombinase
MITIINMKVVIYTRVSTKGQNESGLGRDAQMDYLNNFLKNAEIVKEFSETASAKNITKRPILQDAIKFCNDNGCVLAVAKLDRLSRNVIDGLTIFKNLKNGLFSCDVPSEDGLLKDEFMLTLLLAFAQRERELIAIRTKSALKAKKERGDIWNADGNGNYKKINLENVRKAAIEKTDSKQNLSRAKTDAILLHKKGETLTKIAEILTTKGHMTSRSDNKMFEKKYNWTATAVKRLLENDKI